MMSHDQTPTTDRFTWLYEPRGILTFLGLIFLWRICFLLIAPLDLIADEAYYWDWSRRIDYCYYSKPPMIAWINYLSTGLLGSHEVVVRLPAVILGTVSLYLVYLLGSKLFSRKVGFWSTAIMAMTPGNCVLSLVMTIDSPLLFFWGVALYSYWMSLHAPSHRNVWWFVKVLAIGLGLLSKQTMIAFLPMSMLYLILTPQDNKEMRRPRFILGNIASLCFILPMVYWNSQHGWVTAQHTASHFSNRATNMTERITYGFEFIAGQMGVVTPILWLLIIATFAICIRKAMDLSKEEKFLISFSIPGFLVVTYLSFRQRMEPNWPAVFYPTAIMLATSLAFRYGDVFSKLTFPNRVRPYLIGTAASFCLATYLVPALSPVMANVNPSWDLTSRLRGWSQLADRFESELAIHGISPETPIIGQSGRSIVSEMAFYMHHQPKIVLWSESDIIETQYDLWRDEEFKAHKQAIIITEKSRPVSEKLSSHFTTTRQLTEIIVPISSTKSRTYTMYLAECTDSNQPTLQTADHQELTSVPR
ncbi:ArnT family glycosyltransferase [Lacunimicrobium album]